MIAQKRAPPLARWVASLDHVLGDGRLNDLEPELQQFAVDARRSPERIFHAHLLDQRTKVRVDLGSPSPGTRLPTPIAAKAGPMPTHERLGTDDREDLHGRRKPSIQLDKEPAIVASQLGAPTYLTPQNDQLMSEGRVLCYKPALRLEWRGQDGQDEAEQ